ncbi:MAG: PBP1A family penicillin-binding protein [Desulfuromonadaceae bacterium]|nr:PBP1A family penicillin-binding protein [Desulfuromonadaceae bacterium]MDD2854181.1 PBP1A family penicillin-binding protein [Desulfuromonadaceae bacterium]
MRGLIFFQKAVGCLTVTGLFLLIILSSSAMAQDNFASYPNLPYGYSSIRVFDNQSRFVGRILSDKRYWVSIDRIPIFLQKAVIAVEDARFYEHGGIDVRGIARALVKDVVKRRFVEGGSTITQQLIKNRYLSSEKTIERKFDEARMSIEFEQKYNKKQILEMYFNEIYYGNGAWGIAQAARLYFDKNPEELNESECAMLAGVQKNPAHYNPYGKSSEVTGRRDVVLKRMLSLEMISKEQSRQLRANPPVITKKGEVPQYMALLRNKLIKQYGSDIVEQGGLEITAALDLNLQKTAEHELKNGVKRYSPHLQGALITMDMRNGNVLAAVGGADTAQAGYNRAFSAKRQPGSAIKPFIYAAALEKGVTVGSLWNDIPATYDRGNGETWKPLNYGREEYGELSLREALAYSNNVIAVKLLETIGVPYFVDFAAKAGISLQPESGLSLALGTSEVSLNELLLAYTTLGRAGVRTEPRFIIRVYDRKHKSWLENPPVMTSVISPASAYITTDILKDVMTYGTAKNLKQFNRQYPSAGKTGTTDDYRDAWFVGYTPELITGVWVGYDKPKPGGKGFTGGAVAAPIWEKVMRKAVATTPATGFARPDSVISVIIDPATGFLATPDCPETLEEFYIFGTEPMEYCHELSSPESPAPTPPAVEDQTN